MMYRRHNSFCAVWLVKTDVSIEELKLQPEEVAEAKWATRTEIKEMAKEGIWVDYFYLDFMFHLIEEDLGTM